MTETPTAGEYDIDAVSGIDELRSRMAAADTVTDWSFILSDYIKFGNNKVADTVGIFNLNSATDCNNRNTKHCQVPDGECYAFVDEERYGTPLEYRRRQEYLWDCLDAYTFAAAFNELVSRKRNEVTAVRFSESGDFRHRGDIVKVNTIADLIDVDVYTYSASSYLEWSEATNFTVNMSDNRTDESGDYVTRDYGDRRFTAVETADDLSDGEVLCPFDYYDGDDLSERPKCGECKLCINDNGPDVAISLH